MPNTVKKTSGIKVFWQNKKHDLLMFFIVTVLLQGIIGTWIYNKYIELDKARERTILLPKKYLQIKTMRKVIGIILDNDLQLLKEIRDKNLISEKEFITRWDLLSKLEKSIHVFLSLQQEE